MRHFMLTLALCSACGSVEDEATTATARQDALRRRGDDDGIIIMNGLPPSALGESLLLNDEATRLELVSSKLETGSFSSGALALAVNADARAAEVLSYVVRCALEPSAFVAAAGRSFQGELGLCPEWAHGGIAGNDRCQGRVTACMLGLSNVVGAHVPVSMRGVGELELMAASTMTPSPLNSRGTQIRSHSACSAVTYGTASDCGWESLTGPTAVSAGIADVFACTPGVVRVGAGRDGLGSLTPGSDKVLRICAGSSGCDHADALAEDDRYRPLAEFYCPRERSYVVMQRDYVVGPTPRTLGTMTVGHGGASLGAGSEVALFPYREGAFFGTIFEGQLGRTVTYDPKTKSLITSVSSLKDPVFERLYSCLDADWNSVEAYEAKRLCSLGTQCLSRGLGVCQAAGTTPGVCGGISADLPVGSGSFKACVGADGRRYDDALSTFLRSPCDLITLNTQSPDCMR
jgi:hypothetical protein